MMAVEETVGQRIKRLRDGRRWTQTDLASKSGVSYATISRLERGVETRSGRHNRATMVALATALGVSVEDITGDQ
jgi:transcriptional regulator with XRE-family HTH domain